MSYARAHQWDGLSRAPLISIRKTIPDVSLSVNIGEDGECEDLVLYFVGMALK